jgi:hypothetical protein
MRSRLKAHRRAIEKSIACCEIYGPIKTGLQVRFSREANLVLCVTDRFRLLYDGLNLGLHGPWRRVIFAGLNSADRLRWAVLLQPGEGGGPVMEHLAFTELYMLIAQCHRSGCYRVA